MRAKRKLHFDTPVVAAPKRKLYRIDRFRGVDFLHTPLDVDISRSPDAVNMIRDEVGRIRKRFGYAAQDVSPYRINAGFSFQGEKFIHSGGAVYRYRPTVLEQIGTISSSTSAMGWELGNGFFLVDGKAFRVIRADAGAAHGYSMLNLSTSTGIGITYTPVVIISRSPSGGGKPYEGYNLISRAFTNSFYVDAGDSAVTSFQLTNGNLWSGYAVTAKVLDASGNWIDKTEGTDFTVNRTTGVVTFSTAPGQSPVTGEDNVRITAALGNAEYADNAAKIDGCTFGTLYGVNGATDRLFLSGNARFPGMDWYSEPDNPLYFPDLNYSKLGVDEAPIVGYSVVQNRLVAHKRGAAEEKNAVLRLGTMMDVYEDGAVTGQRAAFPIVNVLQGKSSVSARAHAFLQQEPLFLTDDGVYAIAAQDVTGERYSQQRSAFVNPRLTAESGLPGAFSVVYNDFYLLFAGNRIYALDALQRAYEKDEPFSSFQYEGYFLDLALTGETATAAWVWDGRLWFGTDHGTIYAFQSDASEGGSYTDHPRFGDPEGQAIAAHWDTPFLMGSVIYNRKIFRYIGVTLAPFYVNTLTVYGKELGIWKMLFRDRASATYFDFNHVDFSRLSFKTDTSPITVHHKIYVGVVDKAQFRVENAEVGEPFGVYGLTIEYTETGKIAD